MAVSALHRNSDSVIPAITCPQCGAQMSLARIEPEGSDDHDRMFFECVCGFEYRLSDRANKGR
jgi:DNA-directed RNA polymerase subunit M/transcription elongation factor TFIIS